MILSIYGIENKLEFSDNELALLNIHNKELYPVITKFLRDDLENSDKNEVVIFNDGKRMDGKDVLYIQDLETFRFDDSKIIKQVISQMFDNIHIDPAMEGELDKLYLQLIEPFIETLNLLDADYSYENQITKEFYKKIPKVVFDFPSYDSFSDKLIDIINISVKSFDKKCIIVNRALPLFNENNLQKVESYVNHTNVPILFIDYLSEEDISISNNLTVDEEYGSYTLPIRLNI